MPGYACPIKERMLYSSSRNPVINFIENDINLNIEKKVFTLILFLISILDQNYI